MSDGVVVRALHFDDRPRVRALHQEAFEPGEALNDMVLMQIFLHERAVNLVAERDGEVVGFVACLEGSRSTARILTIHVSPAARGQGVARHLLESLEARLTARGVRELALEVHVDNVPAIALYGSAGFSVRSRDPEAYPRRDPPDGLVMQKSLAAAGQRAGNAQ